MIDPSLLDRLRKADLATFDSWINIHDDCYIKEESDLSEAWLQHVLQEAIRARKLYFSMTQTTPGPRGGEYRASIRFKRIYVEGEVRLFGEDPWPRLAECNGNSPAEALLKAHLEAAHG